jgi:hypothetical protein
MRNDTLWGKEMLLGSCAACQSNRQQNDLWNALGRSVSMHSKFQLLMVSENRNQEVHSLWCSVLSATLLPTIDQPAFTLVYPVRPLMCGHASFSDELDRQDFIVQDSLLTY